MRPHNLFLLELASSWAGGRTIFLRLGVTLLVGAPFALIAMPPRIAAAGLVMVITLTSFFGAAVSTARAREAGRMEFLLLLPLKKSAIYLDLWLAASLVDLLQVAPLLGLFVLARGIAVTPQALATLAGALSLSLLLLNALGILVGRILKGNAEVHLAGALGVGLIAVCSGLLPLPARIESLLQPLLIFNPLHHLASCLAGLAGAGSQTPILWGLGLLALLIPAQVRGLAWGSRDSHNEAQGPI